MYGARRYAGKIKKTRVDRVPFDVWFYPSRFLVRTV